MLRLLRSGLYNCYKNNVSPPIGKFNTKYIILMQFDKLKKSGDKAIIFCQRVDGYTAQNCLWRWKGFATDCLI
jgi:hypothetical protein